MAGEALRVGIIGAGPAGRAHAAAFARLAGVAVTAVWGRTRARAEELAAGLAGAGPTGAPGARVYDAWEDVIGGGEVDVVSLATPPLLRRAPAEAALERGLHVLAEKEFTLTLEDARALGALAARAGTVTAVSLNWRYAPGNLVARRAVADGRIGRLTDIRMESRYRLRQPLAAFPPWTLRPDQGGGTLRDFGSHEFDRARFLTGWEFARLVGRLAGIAEATPPAVSPDGHYLVLAEMSAGGLGSFRSTMTRGEAEWRTVLCGTDGTLAVTNARVTQQRGGEDTPVALPIPPPDEAAAEVSPNQHTWNRLIADFVAAIRAGDVAHSATPALPSFADGLRLQEVFAAVERSNAEGCWIALEDVRSLRADG
jgi:predicted dehydrogenase